MTAFADLMPLNDAAPHGEMAPAPSLAPHGGQYGNEPTVVFDGAPARAPLLMEAELDRISAPARAPERSEPAVTALTPDVHHALLQRVGKFLGKTPSQTTIAPQTPPDTGNSRNERF